jgi:hypothetical protein
MRWGDGVGDGHFKVRRPTKLQAFPLRGVRVPRLGQGVTLQGLSSAGEASLIPRRGIGAPLVTNGSESGSEPFECSPKATPCKRCGGEML